MGLNIKKLDVDRRTLLKARAGRPVARINLRTYLKKDVWPLIPRAKMGRTLSRKQEDQILGYGPEGF